MAGEKLHKFDLRLCRYVLDNLRAYLDLPAFAAFVEERLPTPLHTYLRALDEPEGPPPARLLLTEEDLDDLAQIFLGGPLRFDRTWNADEELHRSSVACATEIRATLAGEYAEQWALTSAQFARRLEAARAVWLHHGMEIVRAWVGEVRRWLRAMDAVAYLPHPEGAFPTPTCPAPPALPTSEVPPTPPSQPHGPDAWLAAIAETRALHLEVRDLLLTQRQVKAFYTTAEIGTALGKSEFTVREWCRLGQCRAEKQKSYRGGKKQWMVPHAEFLRLQNEGPAPLGTYRLPSAEN